MDCSKPGFPVLHHLPEFAQTHVHWVSDAIQISHPLSRPSSPAVNPSQHQSFLKSRLFASCGQSIEASASESVLPMNILGWYPRRLTDLISLLSKGLSRGFSRTTIWKHQFFNAQLSSWYNSHILTSLLEKSIPLTIQTLNFDMKMYTHTHTYIHTHTHLWKHSLNRIKENMNEARYQLCYFELLESDVNAKVKMKHLWEEECRREESTPSNWEQRTW